MPLLKANRHVQESLWAEFTFNLTDTMKNVSGAEQSFAAAAGVFDPIKLPPNAVVIGGDVTVETVSNDTGTATIAVGDAANANRYLGATSIKAAGRTPLVPTGFRGTGQDIRLTLANQNGNATAGKVTVRVGYLITGRATGVQAS